MKKFTIILISLLICFGSWSQNTEQSITSADSFFCKKQYLQAESLYRRVVFFGNEQTYSTCYFKLAECLFHTSQDSDALFYYDIAYQNEKIDSIRDEITFRKALIYIKLTDYVLAQRELLNIDTFQNKEIQHKLFFYLGVINFRQEKYDTSEMYFIGSLKNNSPENIAKIQEIFTNSLPNGKPNPGKAKTLSILMPGLGQLYSGDIKNALNSFLLNAVIGGVYVYITVKYSWIDAAFSVIPWFQRYYIGGYNRAEQIAINKQNEKKDLALLKIIELLSSVQ